MGLLKSKVKKETTCSKLQKDIINPKKYIPKKKPQHILFEWLQVSYGVGIFIPTPVTGASLPLWDPMGARPVPPYNFYFYFF